MASQKILETTDDGHNLPEKEKKNKVNMQPYFQDTDTINIFSVNINAMIVGNLENLL